MQAVMKTRADEPICRGNPGTYEAARQKVLQKGLASPTFQQTLFKGKPCQIGPIV